MKKTDLFNALSTGISGVGERSSYVGRTISPSYMNSVGLCPMKAFVERFSKTSYDSYLSNSLDAEGTTVHNAIESAFDYLIDRKPKGVTDVDKLISQAKDIAERKIKSGMPYKKDLHGNMISFMNEVIEDHGREFLTNPDLFMATEFDVASRNLPGRQVGGSIDFLVYNRKTRHVKIWDLKWARKTADELSHDFATSPSGTFNILKQNIPQPMVYTQSLLDRFGDNISSISFGYDKYLYDETSGTPAARQKVSSSILENTSTNRDSLKESLKTRVSSVINMEQKVSSLITGRDKDSVLRAITTLSKGKCSPGMCNACPMRYQCSFKVFVAEAVESSKGEEGVWSIDNELNKFEHLKDRVALEDTVKSHEEFLHESMIERFKEVRSNLDGKGISKIQTSQIAYNEAKLYKESLKEYTKTKRGLFMDSLVAGAHSPKSELMFSILDRDRHAAWMSNKVRRNIERYSYMAIEQLADSFEVPADLAKEVVMDAVYKDRKTARTLNRQMVSNVNKVLEDMYISLKDVDPDKIGKDVEDNVRFAMKKYSKTIDKSIATTINESLNKEFLKFVLSVDQSAIEQKLGPVTGKSLNELIQDATKQNLMNTNINRFISEVAKNESFGTIMERAGGSVNKFPLGSVMLAGMLTYVSGMNSINDMITGKLDKMSFYLSHNKEEIDAAQHASVYSSSRRIMYSDFGSPMRWVYRRSKMILDFMRINTGNLKDTISAAIGLEGKNPEWRELAVESFVSARRTVVEHAKDNMKYLRKNPGLLAAGAATGFIAFGILPHIHTDRDVKQAARERKEKERKIKKLHWNRTSAMEAPEGDLRAWYRRWLPIGSSVFSGVAAEFISQSLKNIPLMKYSDAGKKVFSDMAPAIKERMLDIWNNVKRRPEDVYSKSALNSTVKGLSKEISSATSERTVSKPMDTVKHSAVKAASIVDDRRRDVTRQTKALTKKSSSKLREIIAGDSQEEISIKKAAGKAIEGAIPKLDELLSIKSASGDAKHLIASSVVPSSSKEPKSHIIGYDSSRATDRMPAEPVDYSRDPRSFGDIDTPISDPVRRFVNPGYNLRINAAGNKGKMTGNLNMYHGRKRVYGSSVMSGSTRVDAPRVDLPEGGAIQRADPSFNPAGTGYKSDIREVSRTAKPATISNETANIIMNYRGNNWYCSGGNSYLERLRRSIHR